MSHIEQIRASLLGTWERSELDSNRFTGRMIYEGEPRLENMTATFTRKNNLWKAFVSGIQVGKGFATKEDAQFAAEEKWRHYNPVLYAEIQSQAARDRVAIKRAANNFRDEVEPRDLKAGATF